MGRFSRIQAAFLNFCIGVIPPMPMLGRSLLYVQSIGLHSPDGHFWYWAPDPEMAPPPYDINGNNKFLRDAKHAPVPTTRKEAKRFIKVIELNHSGMFGWRGELLHLFPQYTELGEEDLAAWNIWINRPETDKFIDDFIIESQRLARGYAVLKGAENQKKIADLKAI